MPTAWSFVRTLVRARARLTGRSFEFLVRPHLDRLYRLAYRFTGSTEDAEDLVQALLLKLIPQEAKLAAVEQLGPWLARSLYYLYIDQTRHRAISPLDQSEPEGDAALQDLVSDRSASPDEAVEQLITRDRIAAAVARLPREQRALIAWHDIEGYTLEELSELHRIPIGTLKSRLHRARARLRAILMQPLVPSERVK
jgi:RNA polymerase sigma-70 factor (ECF subfamily)